MGQTHNGEQQRFGVVRDNAKQLKFKAESAGSSFAPPGQLPWHPLLTPAETAPMLPCALEPPVHRFSELGLELGQRSMLRYLVNIYQ
jgi:hypothetical protein